MDRDRWIALGLFGVGILVFSVGYTRVNDAGISYLPGVALTLAGGVVMGVGGAAEFRGRVGTLCRRRALAIIGTFFGVGVGSVAITPLLGSGDLANVAFLVFFIPATVYWQQQRQSERTLTQTDERTNLLAYKAAFWILVVIVLLSTVLLWARILGVSLPSPESILALVGGISLFGWYGTFWYLKRDY